MSEENFVDPLAVQPVYVEGVRVYQFDGIAHLVFYSKPPEDRHNRVDRHCNCVTARIIIPASRLSDIAAALLAAGSEPKTPTLSEDGARLN
jgi:hypothetical protein